MHLPAPGGTNPTARLTQPHTTPPGPAAWLGAHRGRQRAGDHAGHVGTHIHGQEAHECRRGEEAHLRRLAQDGRHVGHGLVPLLCGKQGGTGSSNGEQRGRARMGGPAAEGSLPGAESAAVPAPCANPPTGRHRRSAHGAAHCAPAAPQLAVRTHLQHRLDGLGIVQLLEHLAEEAVVAAVAIAIAKLHTQPVSARFSSDCSTGCHIFKSKLVQQGHAGSQAAGAALRQGTAGGRGSLASAPRLGGRTSLK